jgi:CarD family transcriptional regulator
MFKVGDKMLHPLHGIGVIEAVTEQEILGEVRRYFVVNLTMKKMKIMIPVDNTEEIGIRKIMKSDQIEEILGVLKSKRMTQMPTNWNRRYKFNLDKIKTGDIKEVAEVLKNLSLKEKKKGLSMGEKKMLENVRNLLVGEIVYSKNVDYDKAKSFLDEALH